MPDEKERLAVSISGLLREWQIILFDQIIGMKDETIWVLGTNLKILSFILQALRKDGSLLNRDGSL